MSRACRCCRRPLSITPASRFRTWITEWFYMAMGECECGSTWAVYLWEAPE